MKKVILLKKIKKNKIYLDCIKIKYIFVVYLVIH